MKLIEFLWDATDKVNEFNQHLWQLNRLMVKLIYDMIVTAFRF